MLRENEILVMRDVKNDMSSHSGFVWPREGPVEAPDWKPTNACGNGLHGLPWGVGGDYRINDGCITLLVAVDTSPDNYVHGTGEMQDKCKFHKGRVVFCGTQDEAIEVLRAYAPPWTKINWSRSHSESCAVQVGGHKSIQTAGPASFQLAGCESVQMAGEGSVQIAGKGTVQIYKQRGKTKSRDVSFLEAGKPYKLVGGEWHEMRNVDFESPPTVMEPVYRLVNSTTGRATSVMTAKQAEERKYEAEPDEGRHWERYDYGAKKWVQVPSIPVKAKPQHTESEVEELKELNDNIFLAHNAYEREEFEKAPFHVVPSGKHECYTIGSYIEPGPFDVLETRIALENKRLEELPPAPIQVYKTKRKDKWFDFPAGKTRKELESRGFTIYRGMVVKASVANGLVIEDESFHPPVEYFAVLPLPTGDVIMVIREDDLKDGNTFQRSRLAYDDSGWFTVISDKET